MTTPHQQPANSGRLKIDIHTHILPKTWPNLKEKYGYGGFIHLDHHRCGCARMMQDDHFFREIEANCWDEQLRLKEYQDFGVQVQVLSTVPVMFSYWAKPQHAYDLSRFLNDHIAGIAHANPRHFVGLGTIPMQSTALAIKELTRCVKELGLAGVQIGSNINDLNLSDPQFFEIFAAAEALDAAVFIHPWNMMGSKTMADYWLPWLVGMPAESARAACSLIFSGVLEKLPRLKVAFAHGGGSFPATIGRIEHGFNVRPDLCAVDNPHNPRNYLNQLYFDSLVHDKAALDYLIQLVGSDRIALGSDYPFPLGELHPGQLIQQCHYPDSLQDQLLHGTALSFLGLDKTRFIG